MSQATLNLKVGPRRMVSVREAAEYCGLHPKYFELDCNVAPVEMPRGKKCYDLRDLDVWLDDLKNGISDADDDILRKLN